MTIAFSYADSFAIGGVGINAGTVTAWKASRFTGIPAMRASFPTGTADAPAAGTITPGEGFGSDGAFVIPLPTSEQYFVCVTYAGVNYWKGPIYGVFEDGSGAGGTAPAGTIDPLAGITLSESMLYMPGIVVDATGPSQTTVALANAAAINTYLGNLPEGGQNNLVLPPGNVYVAVSTGGTDCVSIPAGATLKGSGSVMVSGPTGGTVLASVGTNAPRSVVAFANARGGIESLCVDGAAGAGNAQYGVVVGGRQCKAHDVSIWGGSATGSSLGTTTAFGSDGHQFNMSLFDCGSLSGDHTDWTCGPGRFDAGLKVPNGGQWTGIHWTSGGSGQTDPNVRDMGGNQFVNCYFDSDANPGSYLVYTGFSHVSTTTVFTLLNQVEAGAITGGGTTISAGASVTLTDPTGYHSQTFTSHSTITGGTLVGSPPVMTGGDTSITVNGTTALNYAYPSGSLITVAGYAGPVGMIDRTSATGPSVFSGCKSFQTGTSTANGYPLFAENPAVGRGAVITGFTVNGNITGTNVSTWTAFLDNPSPSTVIAGVTTKAASFDSAPIINQGAAPAMCIGVNVNGVLQPETINGSGTFLPGLAVNVLGTAAAGNAGVIQAYLNFLVHGGQNNWVLPPGNIAISQTINPPQGVTLKGSGTTFTSLALPPPPFPSTPDDTSTTGIGPMGTLLIPNTSAPATNMVLLNQSGSGLQDLGVYAGAPGDSSVTTVTNAVTASAAVCKMRHVTLLGGSNTPLNVTGVEFDGDDVRLHAYNNGTGGGSVYALIVAAGDARIANTRITGGSKKFTKSGGLYTNLHMTGSSTGIGANVIETLGSNNFTDCYIDTSSSDVSLIDRTGCTLSSIYSTIEFHNQAGGGTYGSPVITETAGNLVSGVTYGGVIVMGGVVSQIGGAKYTHFISAAIETTNVTGINVEQNIVSGTFASPASTGVFRSCILGGVLFEYPA